MWSSVEERSATLDNEDVSIEVNIMEKVDLLNKLDNSMGKDYRGALVELVRFYLSHDEISKALEYLWKLLNFLRNWNETMADVFPPNLFWAEFSYNIGMTSSYLSFSKHPELFPSIDWHYFIGEWFSYALNLSGLYRDAEAIARHCLEKYPVTPYLYLNLGISLEGQGKYYEAARSYRTSVIADHLFVEGLYRLENLFSKHHEIPINMPILGTLDEESNEFHRMHDSNRRSCSVFSGEVKEGDIRTILEECNEKICKIQEEG
jgi:tetratricopeptide (TPR) repeat protein